MGQPRRQVSLEDYTPNPAWFAHQGYICATPPKSGFTYLQQVFDYPTTGGPVPPNRPVILGYRDPAQRLLSAYNHFVLSGSMLRFPAPHRMWYRRFGPEYIKHWFRVTGDPLRHFERFVTEVLPEIVEWGYDLHWCSTVHFANSAGIDLNRARIIDYREWPEVLAELGLQLPERPKYNHGVYDIDRKLFEPLAHQAAQTVYKDDLKQFANINTTCV